MGTMTLTDRTNTFTSTKQQERAVPIWNANTSVTIGGNVKSQADSQRLSITVNMRLTQTQLATLQTVIKNFAVPLYYTPGRKLYDKTAIAEMPVICEQPDVIDMGHNGTEIVYHVTLVLQEVISTTS